MSKLRTLVVQLRPRPIVLVIGGAIVGDGMETLYEDPEIRLVGLDLQDSPNVQLLADAHVLPFADESIDAVVVQAVLEHVINPLQVVTEIRRVLKTDGLVYSETPFLQQVHEGPYDFTRYTESGHRFLFRWFEEIDAGNLAGAGTQLLWSLDHATRTLFRSKTMGLVIRTLFSWVRILDAIGDREFALDTASATYFLGRRSSIPIGPREAAQRYRGAQR